MIGYISSLVQLLFHFVNEVWVNPVLDLLMPALSFAGSFGAKMHAEKSRK